VSISAISGQTLNASTTGSASTDFGQQFKQLADALDSGDLSDAQQAYADLSQLQDSGQGPSANSNSPLAKVLGQIGQSLQSGDLTGAQQSLQSFQQARGGHHHHGHHGGASAAPQTTPPTSNTTTSSTDPGSVVDVTA
jgi:soluble cytochrome b562